MKIFTAIYFLALIIEIVIRAPLDRQRKAEKMSERRYTDQEKTLLGLLSLGGLVAPSFTHLQIGWILQTTHYRCGQVGWAF